MRFLKVVLVMIIWNVSCAGWNRNMVLGLARPGVDKMELTQ